MKTLAESILSSTGSGKSAIDKKKIVDFVVSGIFESTCEEIDKSSVEIKEISGKLYANLNSSRHNTITITQDNIDLYNNLPSNFGGIILNGNKNKTPRTYSFEAINNKKIDLSNIYFGIDTVEHPHINFIVCTNISVVGTVNTKEECYIYERATEFKEINISGPTCKWTINTTVSDYSNIDIKKTSLYKMKKCKLYSYTINNILLKRFLSPTEIKDSMKDKTYNQALPYIDELVGTKFYLYKNPSDAVSNFFKSNKEVKHVFYVTNFNRSVESKNMYNGMLEIECDPDERVYIKNVGILNF